MPQLVGCRCVLCEGRIASESEGRFCEGCGNPVHHACGLKPEVRGGGTCADCGVNLTEAAILRARQTNRKRPLPQGTGPYPIASSCPKCGDKAYRLARPEMFIAFRWDRVCKECETRYTPPTPQWAAILFLLVGVILAGIGGMSIGLAAPRGSFPVCGGFLGFLGLLSLAHGIRSLKSPGRV